ncbi:MAG: diguanylate cyclase [Pseudomonadota bacterium]
MLRRFSAAFSASCIFAAICWYSPGDCFAISDTPVLVLESRDRSYPLRPVAFLYEDTTCSLTIDEISSERFQGRFVPLALEKKFIGYAPSRFWVRFDLVHSGEADRGSHGAAAWTLYNWEPLMDSIDLYSLAPSVRGRPGWTVTQAGRNRSWQRSGTAFEPIVMGIDPPVGEPATFYLCITNTTVLVLDFSVESRSMVQGKVRILDTVNFLNLGLRAGLMVHSFFMGVMLRDINYLYLTAYIFTGILASLNQDGPAIPFVSDFPPETVDFLRRFSFSMGLVFVILMCRSVFGIPGIFPKSDRLLLLLIPCHLLQWTMTGIMGPELFHGIRFALDDITLVLVMVIGIISWFWGFRPARFFFMAFLVHSTTILLGMASNREWIPMSPVTEVFLPHTLDSAALIAVSLALADNVTRLRIENRALAIKERRLTTLSYTDGLTGLFNKRYLESKLQSEVEHARRIGRDLSVIVLDVDNFKRFNDRFGHLEGDRVLKILGEVLRMSMRDIDSACRFGGEEFVIILPGTGLAGAFTLSERVRREFWARTAALEPSCTLACTLSSGVALFTAWEDEHSLLKRADEALYMAKSSGKDRTFIAVDIHENNDLQSVVSSS